MRTTLPLRFIVIGAVALAPAGHAGGLACQLMAQRNLRETARHAVSPDEMIATAAIAKLREQGPPGLQALFTGHATQVEQLINRRERNDDTSEGALPRLRRALEEVGQQRDCAASQLYWHTDLDAARVAAVEAGKPILSLRLLGKLTDEFSCANSRFFRTVLYANAEVSAYLREHFVLHWESVRPVPKVTIDFGDGRKLDRTITGNSVHYILSPSGEPIDAVPGLYGATDFLRVVRAAEQTALAYANTAAPMRSRFLADYHRTALKKNDEMWRHDLQVAGLAEPSRGENNNFGPVLFVEALRTTPNISPATPPAAIAARVAVAKTAAEGPLVAAVTGNMPDPKHFDDSTWQRISRLHAASARLDASSRALAEAKMLPASRASAIAPAKAFVEDPMLRVLRNFEGAIALDTVRNEYLLHRKIHEWFASNTAPPDLSALNERVYTELFLTPSSDPWLGLAASDSYSALENNSITAP